MGAGWEQRIYAPTAISWSANYSMFSVTFGERAGTRTQDLLIKSQLLYRLSYALEPRSKALSEHPGGRHAEARMRPAGGPAVALPALCRGASAPGQ